MSVLSDNRVGLAFAVWMTYVAGGLYFVVSHNVKRKLRWWRPYHVAGAFLFLGVVFAWGFPIGMMAIAAVLVAVATSINLRRPPPFCPKCGATVWSGGFVSKSLFCLRCGAPLRNPTTPRQDV